MDGKQAEQDFYAEAPANDGVLAPSVQTERRRGRGSVSNASAASSPRPRCRSTTAG